MALLRPCKALDWSGGIPVFRLSRILTEYIKQNNADKYNIVKCNYSIPILVKPSILEMVATKYFINDFTRYSSLTIHKSQKKTPIEPSKKLQFFNHAVVIIYLNSHTYIHTAIQLSAGDFFLPFVLGFRFQNLNFVNTIS